MPNGGERRSLQYTHGFVAFSRTRTYLYGFQEGWYGLFSDRRNVGFGMTSKYLGFWHIPRRVVRVPLARDEQQWPR